MEMSSPPNAFAGGTIMSSPRLELPDRPDLEASRARGLHHLLKHFKLPTAGGAGRFIGRARGRVLETALTLHALRLGELDPLWQRRLQDYLLRHEPEADPISRLFASAVLGRPQGRDAVATLNALLGDLEYGKRRKKALLLMLMVEVGVLPLERTGMVLEDFSARAAHRFSQLYGAASRIIHDRYSGGTSKQVWYDLGFLESCQHANGSWEQQSLITLVAMLGLGPAHPAFARGLQFLRRLEREDGGIPFIPDVDVWFNALAGITLQAGPSLPYARREVAHFIAARQHANGGWSFTDSVQQTDTDCTANCVQVLLQEGPQRFAPAIDRALDYFLELRREDGGYPAYEREGESESTLTANILLVQSLCVHRRPDLLPAMRQARQFLREKQRSDGRFETSWSMSETYSLFRVLWALETHQAVDPDHPPDTVRERALRYLLESQRADGGWGQTALSPSDGLSTAYALSALSLPRSATQVPATCTQRAAAFLLRQQDPETGSFVSIPDQMGPRPIPYDVPLLSTLMSVMALSLALQRSDQQWSEEARHAG